MIPSNSTNKRSFEMPYLDSPNKFQKIENTTNIVKSNNSESDSAISESESDASESDLNTLDSDLEDEDKLLKKQSSRIQFQIAKIKGNCETKNFQKAMKRCTKIVNFFEMNPKFKDSLRHYFEKTLLHRAQVCRCLGNFEEAEKDARQVLTLDRFNFKAVYEIANIFHSKIERIPVNTEETYNLILKDYLIAFSKFHATYKIVETVERYSKTILKINENNAKAQYCLGSIHLQKREFEQAIDCFDKALSLQPNHLSFMLNRIVCSSKIGKEETINKEADEILKKLPLNSILIQGTKKSYYQIALEKNIFFRPLILTDLSKLFSFHKDLGCDLSDYKQLDLNILSSICEKNDTFENPDSFYQFIVIQTFKSIHPKSLATFWIEEREETAPSVDKICHIDVIYTSDDYRKYKFASLLLSYIITYAIKNKCDKIKLISTKEGLKLYLSYGFIKDDYKKEDWEKLSLQEKIEICETKSRSLHLDLKDSSILDIVESKNRENFAVQGEVIPNS